MGNLLDKNEIRRHLKGQCFSLMVYDSVTSTSDLLRAEAEAGAPEGLIIIAEKQSAGRGRVGKSFLSPSGGLYMSLLLRPVKSAAELLAVTPMAAVAVAEAIECVTGRCGGIKWVNDIFLNDRKICGILTESPYDASTGGVKYTSVGIGINVIAPDDGYGELEGIAGALFTGNEAPSGIINRLAAAVADRFYEKYKCFDVSRAYEEYKRRLFIIGRDICAVKNGESEILRVTDLTSDFGLVVKRADGKEKILTSGEISIIPM